MGSFIGVILLLRHLSSKRCSVGYQFWSFIWYHQLLRAFFEETVRENPLFLIKYVNPRWGIGFFTLTQWFTPLVLGIAYYMYKNSSNNNSNGDKEAEPLT